MNPNQSTSFRLWCACFAAVLLVAVPRDGEAGGISLSLNPSYLPGSYLDAITGDNCKGMLPTGTCSGAGAGWAVDAGADNYFADLYERPTAQTFQNIAGTPRSTEYFGYLDLISARYGFDSQYMYFQETMFSPSWYNNTGDKKFTDDFGSGTLYGVQLGTSNDAGRLLLRGEQNKDTLDKTVDANFPQFNSEKAIGYCDLNNDVAGPGGIGGTFEGGNGYENGIILSDGYIESGGTKHYVLFLRSFINADGSVTVELAFNYALYNQYAAANCRITPDMLQSIVFETTRGLKGNQSYLWNDEYSLGSAGSPYGTASQNIYQLDNLRVSLAQEIPQVPEPASLILVGIGLVGLGTRIRRRAIR